MATNPQIVDNWSMLAWRLYTDSRYPEAAYALREARRLNPDDLYTLWLSGLTAYMTGDYEQSRHYLERVYLERRSWPDVIRMDITFDVIGRTHLLALNGDLSSAALYFSKAADLAPRDWKYPFLLGVVEWYRGRVTEAFISIARARQLNDKEPVVLRYFGWTSTAMFTNYGVKSTDSVQTFDAALRAVKSAIKAEPNRYEGYDMLARLYFAAGKFDEAVTPLRRAMEMDAAAVSPKYFLAKLFIVRNSNLKEAEDLLMEAIALNPYYFEDKEEAPHVNLLVSLMMRTERLSQAKAILAWRENLPPRQ